MKCLTAVKTALFLSGLFAGVTNYAQNTFPLNGSVGIGTTTPNASSALEILSTGKGLLISRMTKAQRDAILTPATGLLIYQTDNTPSFYYYSGSAWTKIATGPAGASKTLNNLTAPTAVNVDLLPQNGSLVNIGSSNNSWTNLYIGGSLYLRNYRFLYYRDVSGSCYIGSEAGNLNATGGDNTFVGRKADYNATTGSGNTATGAYALYQNTSGNYNTAMGHNALGILSTGSSNIGIGNAAGYSTNGANNTYLGYNAGTNDNTNNNTAIGYKAGFSVANGNGCTYLGYQAGPTVAGYTNTTGIGYNVTPTASNQARIGNSLVTSIGGQVDWTVFSDGRYKKNIKENVPGLTFINQLKPVTYTLDINGIRQYKGEVLKDEAAAKNESSAQEKTIHTGFIAQEVEAVAKKMNYDFDGVDVPKNDKDLYGIRYAEFVVPLVKAVQELSKMNDDKDAKMIAMQKQIDDLKTLITSGRQSSESISSQALINPASSSLMQNAPNPFSSSTLIKYNIPLSASNAQIVITDGRGSTIKVVGVTGKGAGQVTIAAGSLAAGNYFYSLLVNGKKVDTKQMLILK